MSDAMNRPWVYCPECGLYQKDADAKIVELEEKYTSLLQRQNDAEWQARGCAERLGWDGHGCAVGWLGNKIEEQAQEIERLKANVANWERKEIGRAIDCHGQEQRAEKAEREIERLNKIIDTQKSGYAAGSTFAFNAFEKERTAREKAERGRDEAIEDSKDLARQVREFNTDANELERELDEARMALVWYADHSDIWASPLSREEQDEQNKMSAALRNARGEVHESP